MNSNPSSNRFDLFGFTLLLSLSEIGLGSFLHGLRLPFRGFVMVTNQCALLNSACLMIPFETRKELRRSPMIISTSAGLVKLLSPMGGRLSPMVGITVQGLLFSLGLFVGGVGVIGRMLGSALMAVWGTVHQFFFMFLFYGAFLPTLIEFYNQSFEGMGLSISVQGVALTILTVRTALAMGIAFGLTYLPDSTHEAYHQFLLRVGKRFKLTQKGKQLSPAQRAWKQLRSWPLLISLSLAGIVVFMTRETWAEALMVLAGWIVWAYVLCFILAWITSGPIIPWLEKVGLSHFADRIEPVLERIRLHHSEDEGKD